MGKKEKERIYNNKEAINKIKQNLWNIKADLEFEKRNSQLLKNRLNVKDTLFQIFGSAIFIISVFYDLIAKICELQFNPGLGIGQIFGIIIGFIMFFIGCVR